LNHLVLYNIEESGLTYENEVNGVDIKHISQLNIPDNSIPPAEVAILSQL
jgi:hypothetical protein